MHDILLFELTPEWARLHIHETGRRVSPQEPTWARGDAVNQNQTRGLEKVQLGASYTLIHVY